MESRYPLNLSVMSISISVSGATTPSVGFANSLMISPILPIIPFIFTASPSTFVIFSIPLQADFSLSSSTSPAEDMEAATLATESEMF